MFNNEFGVVRFILGKDNFIVFYNKILLLGWSVASVILEDELFVFF